MTRPTRTPDAGEPEPLRPSQVALAGYVGGCGLALAGVLLQWGLNVALMVAGVVVAVSFVLAYAGETR